VRRWLGEQQRVVAFHETRVLVAIHKFIEEVGRHRQAEHREEFVNMARDLAYDYYSDRCILIGRGAVVEKEPLEPIAFPDRDYAAFLQSVRRLFPEGKFIFMVRDPVSTIWSMHQRKWGYSLVDLEPQSFALDEHVDNWCACADLILDYAEDSNVYVCPFGRLVKRPREESERLLEFLQVSGRSFFKPREVKEVGFDDEERELILSRTRSQVEALERLGISDL
jgi:hypothetical protein